MTTRSDILSAMAHMDRHGIPEGFGPSVHYLVAHPETGRTYPPKAIWGLATGTTAYDFNAVQAKHKLEQLGFHVRDLRSCPAISPAEATADSKFEGAATQVTTNRYERDPALRAACIAHYSENGQIACKVCGFDFFETFGDLGDGFIHIHHTNPLGNGQGEREVNPVEDLIPVCPNCHAMIHRGGSNRSLEDVRAALRRKG